MNIKDDICINILFFEKPEQTIECIESFLPADVKIYVINNNSSEKSTKKVEAFCQKYKNVEYFYSNENLGVSKGRNFLIRNSKERFIFLLDNDIRMITPNWVEILENYIKKYNHTHNVFIPKLKYIDNFVSYDRQLASFYVKNNKLTKVPENDCTNFFGGSSVVDRKLFDTLGLFDENIFANGEEYEYTLRSELEGIKINCKYIEEIELIHEHRQINDLSSLKAVFSSNDISIAENSKNYLAKKYSQIEFSDNFNGKKYYLKNFKTYIPAENYQKLESIIVEDSFSQMLDKYIDKKVFFYGAGQYAKKVIQKLELNKYKILGIIDKDPAKKNLEIEGLPIFHLDEISPLNPEVIILTIEETKHISKILREYLDENNCNNCLIVDCNQEFDPEITINRVYKDFQKILY